jgi:hypothetical protein
MGLEEYHIPIQKGALNFVVVGAFLLVLAGVVASPNIFSFS